MIQDQKIVTMNTKRRRRESVELSHCQWLWVTFDDHSIYTIYIAYKLQSSELMCKLLSLLSCQR